MCVTLFSIHHLGTNANISLFRTLETNLIIARGRWVFKSVIKLYIIHFSHFSSFNAGSMKKSAHEVPHGFNKVYFFCMRLESWKPGLAPEELPVYLIKPHAGPERDVSPGVWSHFLVKAWVDTICRWLRRYDATSYIKCSIIMMLHMSNSNLNNGNNTLLSHDYKVQSIQSRSNIIKINIF